jgi:hypothetical protein
MHNPPTIKKIHQDNNTLIQLNSNYPTAKTPQRRSTIKHNNNISINLTNSNQPLD